MNDILNKIIFWRKWTRKIDKPLLTDEDLTAIEEELHYYHKPDKIYKFKNNKYEKK